jgi:hypothetical protein
MTRGMKMLLIAPFAFAGLAFFGFVGGEIVKSLWNWLMPSIFGLRQLTFWESIGMLALCRILFGGIAGRGLAGSRSGHRMSEGRERFRQRIRERFGAPSSETGRVVPN